MLELQSISQAIDRKPLVVNDDVSVWAVIEQLRTQSSAKYVLVTRNGQLKGIFTAANLIEIVGLEHGWQEMPIAAVMQTPAVTLPESELENHPTKLLELFERHKIDCLPIVDDQGAIVGTLTEQDLGRLVIKQTAESDRKQAEQELKQAKEQLQAVIDAVPGFVSWIDQNGRYIGVNRKLADVLELPPEEIVGKPVGFSGSSSKLKQFAVQFMASDDVTTSQIIDTNFNNRKYHYLVAAQKYNHNQAIVSVGIDITTTQKSQEALRSLVAGTAAVTGTEFFAVLVQYLAQALEVKCAVVAELEDGCSTVALWLNGRLGENFEYDPASTPCNMVIKKGVYYCRSQVGQKFPVLNQFLASEPMESYFGIRLENSAREPIGILCVLDDRPLENEEIARYILSIFAARAAAELERQQVELALKQSKLDLEARVNTRTQDLIAANDELRAEITQKELVKQALAASEEKFRHIFEDAPIGISLVDLNNRYIQVNSRLCRLLGYEATELEGKTLQDVTHPDDLQKELPYLEQVILGQIDSYNLEQRYIRKDGSSWWANLIATVVRDDAGSILYTLGMVEDISDRKRSEQALLQSEERFRKIFESGPLGMAIIGFNQSIIKVNAMLCEMLGYAETEMTRLTLRDITVPEDVNLDLSETKQLYYGRISQFHTEKRYIKKDLSSIWVLVNYSAMRDHSGKTINVLIAVRDITRQREAQEYIQASLQEKEVLLKEIHHRVKNNLHVIANLLDLQAQNIEDEAIADLFIDSQNRIHAMALIHEQLYQSPAAGKVCFREYVENLAENLFQSYCFNIKQIEWQIKIEPVILNLETAIPCGLILNELVANSIKYAFPGCQSGQISIEFRSIEPDHINPAIDNSMIASPRLTKDGAKQASLPKFELVIGDSGVGIPTTIDWQNSTSMGLRLVRILGRQLEAEIELEQVNGTQFRLVFGELKYKERFKAYDAGKGTGG